LGTQTRRLVVEKRNVLRFRGVIEAKFFERHFDCKFDKTSSIWNMSEIVKKKSIVDFSWVSVIISSSTRDLSIIPNAPSRLHGSFVTHDHRAPCISLDAFCESSRHGRLSCSAQTSSKLLVKWCKLGRTPALVVIKTLRRVWYSYSFCRFRM
jgi:hypothetical protein